MFQRDNGERSKFSDYDNTYKEYMVRGQEERGVYVEKVNKMETLILQRSTEDYLTRIQKIGIWMQQLWS